MLIPGFLLDLSHCYSLPLYTVKALRCASRAPPLASTSQILHGSCVSINPASTGSLHRLQVVVPGRKRKVKTGVDNGDDRKCRRIVFPRKKGEIRTGK